MVRFHARPLTALAGAVVSLALAYAACGDDRAGARPAGADGGEPLGDASPIGDGAALPPLPKPACAASGGAASVAAPTLARALKEGGDESWLGSPAIADVDGDGKREVVVVRGGRVSVFRADGTRAFFADTGKDRIWASPVVANFVGDAKLEIAVAARDSVFLFDATGAPVSGFPKAWGSETRSVAAGDVNGDGSLDLVTAVRVSGSGQTDVLMAWQANGSPVAGFPPNRTGTSGCAGTNCYLAGCYDQNLAVGDLDGDGKADLIAPHDNAYASFHRGTGVAFDANAMFKNTKKTPGVRYLHALAEAMQGYANDEATGLQAHFTNTAPALADVDGDGSLDVVMLGSVQNAAQDNRLQGVGLWVLRTDASRPPGWETPFHASGYVMGLSDGFSPTLDGPTATGADNLVGATNQVSIADLDPQSKGLEMVFAGFDGRIHAVSSDKRELWSAPYAVDGRALTGGVVIADLSADGVPEVVFATYAPTGGSPALFVLGANGGVLHKITLPGRGAMAVPSIGDVDGDGQLEIVVSLKDAQPDGNNVLVYSVPGSKPNCLLWPTGRGNLLRSGFVPAK